MRKNTLHTFTNIFFIASFSYIVLFGVYSYSYGLLRRPSKHASRGRSEGSNAEVSASYSEGRRRSPEKYETFANKNKKTMLDVDGNILGFDMIEHHDTFDYETEMNVVSVV